MLPENITKIINNIAKNEGFTEFKIETEAGSKHGDGLMGVLQAVTIDGVKCQPNGTSKAEKLQLLCKMPSSSETRQKNFQLALFFGRELHVYSELFPELIRFQQEKGLNDADSFQSFPKMYACEIDHGNNHFVLVMEDLRPKRYEMWPGENVIPLEHALFVLRELGKLHGISFALKDQRPEQFEKYQQLTDTSFSLCVRGKFQSFTNCAIDRATKALNNPEHRQLMENFRKTYATIIEEILVGKSSKEFGVITHGDCWNNNLLFQYADTDKKQVKAVKFVDWQITRYCPPVLDLFYFIFTSTDKTFRDQYYDQILKAYYSSLSDTIRKLGSDPDKLYTFDNMQSQLRKFGAFALWCAPLIIQLNVAEAKDIVDMDEYAESIEQCEEADAIHSFDERTQLKYSTLINDLVADLLDYGYIQI